MNINTIISNAAYEIIRNKTHFIVIDADITTLKVDVIVNAANHSLLGGGGVDGAIHSAAGSELQEECRLLGGCDVGDAKVTKAYQLPSSFIVHTVGPFYHGGESNEDKTLKKCYRRSLEEAAKLRAKSIAIPCISTGAYRYPAKQAARIAVDTVLRMVPKLRKCVMDDTLTKYDCAFNNEKETLTVVIFVCFGEHSTRIVSKTLTLAVQ